MNGSLDLKRSIVAGAIVVLCIVVISNTNQAVEGVRNVQANSLTGAHNLAPTATSTPAPNGPTLYISFKQGAPTSKFTFTGLQFPANESVSILVNSQPITTMQAVPGLSNWFIFHLDTTQANEGLYIVTSQTHSVTRNESFVLDSNEPVREPLTGTLYVDAPIFLIPPNIAYTSQSFLPLITK
jgi:hypothetical protein